MLMRKNFHLLRRGLKDKNKDVDQYMEWQRNVIRSEYVDEKKSIQTEKRYKVKGEVQLSKLVMILQV